MIYTPELGLLVKGCKLFINCMCDATHDKSFGLILTDINEVRNHIYYILDYIFVFLYRYLYDVVMHDVKLTHPE